MRKLYLLSTLVLTIFAVNTSFAQDFSNKGKEFWLAYCYHVGMVNAGNAPAMTLYITCDVATTYAVEIYGVATLQSGAIAANQVIPVTIPNTYFISTNGLTTNRTIRVTGVKPIVVYSFITRSQASAASLCLPTNVLGKEYYTSSFTQLSNENNASSYITIIAVEDNTRVEITPTAVTVSGWLAGSINTITLNKGQIYQVLGITTGTSGVDLSGTKVKSVASGSGGCKRIAVFSGSGKISIGSPPSCNGGSADNLYQQLYPVASWGKKFLTAPSSGRPFNHYRVMRSDPLTNVYVNGVLIPPASFTNNYYQFYNNAPNLITADIPISVAQYFTSQNCPVNQNPYDPDMIVLNPVEQNINKVTLVNSPLTVSQNSPNQPHQHHIHAVMKNDAGGGTGQASFRFDGAPVSLGSWVIHPQDGSYSYLYLSGVASGNHTLASDSGFNAVAYGYGSAETYGYSAGANVKDLYQQIGVATEFGIEPTPSVCKGSPFKFKVSLPYCADSIKWDLTNLPGPPPSPPTSIYLTCTPGSGGPDSSTVVNGKILYWYSLSSVYTFNVSGTFPVTITTFSPNTDGCGTEQDIDFELNVFDPPVADFTFINSGCVAEPVQFTDNTVTPRPSYIWNWNFGDPGSGAFNTSGLRNPSHIFSAPGTYNVTFSTITTPGCISGQIIKQVIVKPIPTATTSGNVTVCVNDPSPDITFTAIDGTPTYTFTYNINGGSSQTVVTTGTNTSVSLPAPTGVAGTFRYNLLEVKNTGSTLCVSSYTNTYVDVVVNANTGLALTSGSNNQSVCENVAIANINYTISGGGNNATASGLPPGVSGVYNSGTFTISGTPTTSGTYNYTVTATGLCLPNSLSGTITVTAESTLNLTSPPPTENQELCLYSTLINITYEVVGSATGITVTGLPAGITGVFNAGVLTIGGVPTVSGTFNYTVNPTGPCVETNSDAGVIVVNPLPTPNFSVTAPTCETQVLTFTDMSIPNAGVINGWAWNFGDATTSALQNPTHTYAAAGTYTVTLSVTTDKGCVSSPVLSRTVTVNPQPVTGFILPEVCLSDTYAQFTDISSIPSGSIASWLWNFGDPPSGVLNTSTLQNPQHSYTAVGNYTVTLTTTSNNGCISTLSQSFTVNGDIPVSNFNALNPAIMCANDSIAIQDASTVNFGSVTKVEIYWDNVNFPAVFQLDDFPTSGKIYRHLYPNFQSPFTKTFTIRYRAYSGATCVNDKIKTIVVNAAPKVQFTSMPDACLDALPFQITQASEIGGLPGTGVFSGPGVSPTGIFNPASVGPGTYIIKYTYTSTAGGCIDTLSKPITVLDSASAQFTYSPQRCEKTAVTFNSTTSTIPAASGTIIVWSWDFGDPASGAANTSTSQNPSHLFSAWGTYNVKLNVITSNGCRSTVRTIPVFVNPIPRPNFVTPVSACLPSANITFTNTSTIPDGTQGSFGYLWNFGDPPSGILNSSTGSSPSHIYNTSGPFNVNLQVTSGAGCVQDTTIILNTIHPEPIGSFTVNKNDVCIGQSFIFTDNSNPADGTTLQWSWNMGDGNLRTSSSFTYIYGNPGAYTVTLFITNSNGCRSSTAKRTVTVNPYPTVNAGPDLFILEGGSDTLEPIVTAINPSYLWTPNTYFPGSNAIKNPVVKGVQDITYTLTVTGNGGCVASDQVFIKVLKGPEVPNIFSPNGDGVHDKWDIKYLDTYPGGTVEIFNRYGQMIFRSVGYGTPWDGTVNGNPVPMGTYYYIVNPKNGRKIMSGYVDVIR